MSLLQLIDLLHHHVHCCEVRRFQLVHHGGNMDGGRFVVHRCISSLAFDGFTVTQNGMVLNTQVYVLSHQIWFFRNQIWFLKNQK